MARWSNESFRVLREVNVTRCAASFRSLEDWGETDWACAMAGEAGEACNLIKKRRRGDGIAIEEVAKELADVVIYADLLAARMGIDLGEAIRKKFNEVSTRVDSAVRLEPEVRTEGVPNPSGQ